MVVQVHPDIALDIPRTRVFQHSRTGSGTSSRSSRTSSIPNDRDPLLQSEASPLGDLAVAAASEASLQRGGGSRRKWCCVLTPAVIAALLLAGTLATAHYWVNYVTHPSNIGDRPASQGRTLLRHTNHVAPAVHRAAAPNLRSSPHAIPIGSGLQGAEPPRLMGASTTTTTTVPVATMPTEQPHVSMDLSDGIVYAGDPAPASTAEPETVTEMKLSITTTAASTRSTAVTGASSTAETAPSTTTLPITTTTSSSTTTADLTLFCFAVMMSTSYEAGLLSDQLGRDVGIFGCDRYDVYSDTSIWLVQNSRHIYTKNIGNMSCSYGGPFKLALNSEVFARAWRRVFTDGTFLETKWTIKVDPDCVFLPGRLRKLVQPYDESKSQYLNNCNEGLHGPIEIVSRAGMVDFAQGIDDCQTALSSEFMTWGEDVFLRHCMRHIGVERVDNFNILTEDHCFNEDPVHLGCISGRAAFHPFKTSDSFFQCLEQARATG